MDAILLHSGTNMFTVENISSVTNMGSQFTTCISYVHHSTQPCSRQQFLTGYFIVTTILFYYSTLNLNQKLHDFYTEE